MHNRYTIAFCAAAFLGLGVSGSFGPAAALAQEKTETQKVTGIPFVQDSGVLVINGKDIALWGIERLAPDQRCWQVEMDWCCGEYAEMALKHFVQGRTVECTIKQDASHGLPALALCQRSKGSDKKDVAEHLVEQGWALDKKDSSSGYYQTAEQTARENKRGAWSSRFQSAQDWKDGVQRFIGESNPDNVDEEFFVKEEKNIKIEMMPNDEDLKTDQNVNEEDILIEDDDDSDPEDL